MLFDTIRLVYIICWFLNRFHSSCYTLFDDSWVKLSMTIDNGTLHRFSPPVIDFKEGVPSVATEISSLRQRETLVGIFFVPSSFLMSFLKAEFSRNGLNTQLIFEWISLSMLEVLWIRFFIREIVVKHRLHARQVIATFSQPLDFVQQLTRFTIYSLIHCITHSWTVQIVKEFIALIRFQNFK